MIMIPRRIAVLILSLAIILVFFCSFLIDMSENNDNVNTGVRVLKSMLDSPTLRALSVPEEHHDRQLVFIGDVHGMYDKLLELVDKLNFETTPEMELVFLGDFITKGPDSTKVLDWMIKHEGRVHFVLGNNEFSVIMGALDMGLLESKMLNNEQGHDVTGTFKKSHAELAQQLNPPHYTYLFKNAAVVLEFDMEKTRQRFIAVHAGILPQDYDFERRHVILKSDVFSILNMKFVNEENSMETSREKQTKHWKRWYKLWEKELDNHHTKEQITILYGHDAKKGLNLRKYTKGLDSACVKGGKLSAMHYMYDPHSNSYKETLVEV